MKTDTAQRNIPTGWRTTTIEDVCENLDNLRKPVTKSNREPGDVPYYGATGIVDYVKDYIFDEPLLLIGEDGADWSKFANTAYEIDGKSWVNNHAHVLRCTKAHRTFLKEYLNYADLNSFITGGTRGKLTKGVLSKIPIPLPSSDEQKKIAEILETVDEEIAKTDEIIAATEKLKRGLMAEIFTSQRGWKKIVIKDIGEIVTGTTPRTAKKENYGGEFIWISPRDIVGQKYISESTKMLSTEGFAQTRKLPAGSVLVVCIGSTIGKVGIATKELSTNQQINSIIVNDKNDNEFIYYALLFNKARILEKAATQAVPIINKSTFSNISITAPTDKNEQRKIAATLSSLDEKVAVNQKLKAKLTILKKGLMQDLLSGKKRTI